MSRNTMNLVKMGAIGALAGVVLVPVLSSKTRRRITRTTRNAYFKMTDLVQDAKEMVTK